MWAEDATARALPATPEAIGPSLRSPLDPRRRIRAVLFDLDGTLYRQGPMRALMALEVSASLLARPLSGRRHLRTLAAYRRAQEALRRAGGANITPTTQLQRAAEHVGLTVDEVEQIVNEWMFRRPLKYLPLCRAAGLSDLLSFLQAEGLRTGVLSDYPAEGKLRALGVAGRFSLVLCSSDLSVGALKPNPRGFLRACERWEFDPPEVLVVGDRVDVDGSGAVAAGMPCVIIGRPTRAAVNQAGVVFLDSLERLHGVLADRR